jgi:hypothetical protein
VLVAQLAEAHDDTRGEDEDEHLQVHEEGWPGGRLVLGDGGDNGDVPVRKSVCESKAILVNERLLLGITCIPERVETSCPGSDLAIVGEEYERKRSEETSCDQSYSQKLLEVLRGNVGSDELCEGHNLEETEDT